MRRLVLVAAGVDLVRVHAEREHRADPGPAADAADAVDLHAGRQQLLEHADVREAACAAAREHHARRAPRQPPRRGFDAGAPGWSVLDAEPAPGDERARPLAYPQPVASIDEHEVARAQLRVPEDPVRDGAAGREREHPVGLAQAQLGPRVAPGRHLREHDDVVVVALVGVQDLQRRPAFERARTG